LIAATSEGRQSADHVTVVVNFDDEVRRRLVRESR
jgi:hypothetical protein